MAETTRCRRPAGRQRGRQPAMPRDGRHRRRRRGRSTRTPSPTTHGDGYARRRPTATATATADGFPDDAQRCLTATATSDGTNVDDDRRWEIAAPRTARRGRGRMTSRDGTDDPHFSDEQTAPNSSRSREPSRKRGPMAITGGQRFTWTPRAWLFNGETGLRPTTATWPGCGRWSGHR